VKELTRKLFATSMSTPNEEEPYNLTQIGQPNTEQPLKIPLKMPQKSFLAIFSGFLAQSSANHGFQVGTSALLCNPRRSSSTWTSIGAALVTRRVVPPAESRI